MFLHKIVNCFWAHPCRERLLGIGPLPIANVPLVFLAIWRTKYFQAYLIFFDSLFRPAAEPDINNLDSMGSDVFNSSATKLSQSEVDDLGLLDFLTNDLVADGTMVTEVQGSTDIPDWSEFEFDIPVSDSLSSYSEEQPMAVGVFDDLDETDQKLVQKSFDDSTTDLALPADGFGVVQLADQLT